MLGVMIDCSRNAVMNVKSIQHFVDILAKMGYDTLMLYTEDTYEVDNQPLFGYKRGRYTKKELKELDTYCGERGIELIPCIQTLAHLNCIFKWWDEYHELKDYDDILMIDDERTYQLIHDMFSTISECFSTKRIHIGMDEAFQVGLGQYLEKHGYEERFDLINRHLHKVCEMADEFGFEPMIWSDMFCKLALGNADYYEAGNLDDIRRKAKLPENVSLVYWDYYGTDYARYEQMLKVNQAFDRNVVFAGGAWTWKGFISDNRLSMETMLPAVKACKECGVKDILFTMWGDDGGECSRFSVLPSLFYAAQICQGNTDMHSIKAKFKEVVGMDFDAFLLLEDCNRTVNQDNTHGTGSSKCLFYNDPFMGNMNYKVTGDENAYYRSLRDRLNDVGVLEDYRLYFDYAKALCDVLTVKSELGVRTREAYQNGDKDRLRVMAETEYVEAIDKIKTFHRVYQAWWMSENKPQGFDIQDIRMGGLIQRLASCRERILSYCDGIVDEIPEFMEDIIPANFNLSWAGLATVNVLSHKYF